jgi:hypothetical protein
VGKARKYSDAALNLVPFRRAPIWLTKCAREAADA